MAIVAVRGLTKHYGSVIALRGVDLDVAPGEFVVVLGPSGAGKSTLLRCINRLAEPTAGTVTVDGDQASSHRRELRALRRKVAMIFQHFNVVRRVSVLTNVLTGRLASVPAALSLLRVFPQRDVDIAMECLRRVELDDRAAARTDTLSGGQQQRVGIARALAQQPKVILADEPVASLDPKTARTVLRYLKEASGELGISVICNLHQVDFAVEFGERVVGISAGRVVYDGSPADVTRGVLQTIYPGLETGPGAAYPLLAESAPAASAPAPPRAVKPW